jgi:hypothetical protein
MTVTPLAPLTPGLATTRTALHRIAAHVLGRRRFAVTGRFGLRATPGGFGTPAFGEPTEVVRVAGLSLLREVGAQTTGMSLEGATLRGLAEFVDADVTAEFSVGHETPPAGDVDAPIAVTRDAADVLAGWYGFGWRVLDDVITTAGPATTASVVQLWPEHFDAGSDLDAGPGERVNLGASPGDAFSALPYLYVGPWSSARPGGPSYWNAPFGALLAYDDLLAAPDPIARGVAFLRRGIALLRGETDP